MKKHSSVHLLILCVLFTFPSTANAHETNYNYAHEGLFAGSMNCAGGEFGILFQIMDDGKISREEFDRVNGTCRSGSGPCNDRMDREFERTRRVKGYLNLFPTAANPKAPYKWFEVTGTGTREESELSRRKAMLDLSQIHNYLEIQSTRAADYPNDMSGMQFKITVSNPLAKPPYDKMFAQITSQQYQCHNLTLTKIKER